MMTLWIGSLEKKWTIQTTQSVKFNSTRYMYKLCEKNFSDISTWYTLEYMVARLFTQYIRFPSF